MVRENNDVYRANIPALLESIRSTVQALADGKITEKDMPVPGRDGVNRNVLRYAPSFVEGQPGADGAPGYTALSLGLFLGMVKKGGSSPSGMTASVKLRIALAALALERAGFPIFSFQKSSSQ